MRRVLTLLVAAVLVLAFAGSTAARTSRLAYAHAQLSLDGTTAIGWLDFNLTTPSNQDPSPGFIEFNGAADYEVRSFEILVTDAGFYWDDGGPAATWGQGTVCTFAAPGDYGCQVEQFWIVDSGNSGAYDADWFVLSADGNPNDGTWYKVISGDIVVQVPAGA